MDVNLKAQGHTVESAVVDKAKCVYVLVHARKQS
jgi:hypothetical protein